ncbi:MAG: hypothetical protein ACOC53_03705 [Candidatus Saliniplasma sp.]
MSAKADEDEIVINFNSQGTPSRSEWDTLEIYIGGDLIEGYSRDDFTFLTLDGEVGNRSSLTLTPDITYAVDWQ